MFGAAQLTCLLCLALAAPSSADEIYCDGCNILLRQLNGTCTRSSIWQQRVHVV
jgi:hypothetical protein